METRTTVFYVDGETQFSQGANCPRLKITLEIFGLKS